MAPKLEPPYQANGTGKRLRIDDETNKSESPDCEFQRLAAGWAHFIRVCEIIRRSDTGEPPFQVVS